MDRCPRPLVPRLPPCAACQLNLQRLEPGRGAGLDLRRSRSLRRCGLEPLAPKLDLGPGRADFGLSLADLLVDPVLQILIVQEDLQDGEYGAEVAAPEHGDDKGRAD